MSNKFNEFLSELSDTNSTLGSFVDFDKVLQNINKISIKLYQLDFLIGQNDLQGAIKELFEENPKCFSILNILIAVRDDGRWVLDDKGHKKQLYHYFKSSESIYEFIVETGLDDVFKNKRIKNLVDYVFGIEVGLDTNARKNRVGKYMEKVIEEIFNTNKISFKTQIKSDQFAELQNFGEDVKCFDFVIQTNSKTYLIETNYYNSSGSKLNEVARAYKELALKIGKYKNFEFVWITDGKGWLNAKNKLEDAYNNIPLIFNLNSLHSFIEKIKKEQ